MRDAYESAQQCADSVRTVGRDSSTDEELEHLGLEILKFTMAACRLLNSLLQPV
jgi:hypothetical protein